MLSDKSKITCLIQGIEAGGLVTRRPHPTDGRTICLYLTATGESLLDEVSTRHTSLNNQRWSFLSADLSELLERLQVVKVVLENQLDGNRI